MHLRNPLANSFKVALDMVTRQAPDFDPDKVTWMNFHTTRDWFADKKPGTLISVAGSDGSFINWIIPPDREDELRDMLTDYMIGFAPMSDVIGRAIALGMDPVYNIMGHHT